MIREISGETLIRKMDLRRKKAHCPECGTVGRIHSIKQRRLREAGSRPTVIEITHNEYECHNPGCGGRNPDRKHNCFSLPLDIFALPSSRYTNRAREIAEGLVLKKGYTLETASQEMQEKYHVHIPPTTISDWTKEKRGKDSELESDRAVGHGTYDPESLEYI